MSATDRALILAVIVGLVAGFELIVVVSAVHYDIHTEGIAFVPAPRLLDLTMVSSLHAYGGGAQGVNRINMTSAQIHKIPLLERIVNKTLALESESRLPCCYPVNFYMHVDDLNTLAKALPMTELTGFEQGGFAVHGIVVARTDKSDLFYVIIDQ